LTGKERTLTPEEFAKIIRVAGSLASYSGEGVRYRLPGVVEIDVDSFNELYVIGDLHGDLPSLNLLLNTSGLLEKLGKGVKAVFLGDYVDRGAHQIDLLAYLLELKIKHPGDVILLRGNHEPPSWLTPYPHDFPYRVSQYFGSAKSSEIMRLTYMLFERLPLAAVVEGEAVFLHGGPPFRTMSASSLEDVLSIGDPACDDLDLESILWSDPIDEEIELAESIRGAGFLYGFKVTDRFLKLTGAKFIVRGHEAVDGYKMNHEGRVITVFSAPGPYELSSTGLVRLVKTDSGFKYELLKIGVSSRRIIDSFSFESIK